MSSIQIPNKWSDNGGNLTPRSRDVMYKIAALFAAPLPGILPEQFNFSPVTGTPFGAVYLNSSGQVVSTAAMTNGQILMGRTGNTPTLNTLTGTANQITVTNGAGSITLSLPQNIGVGSSPTFTGLTLSGLAANAFTYSGAGGALTSTAAPTNGQLLIGSTGAAPVAATITGTANQITVTNSAGGITLSTPAKDGTYTPTLTNVANLDASTAYQCQYFRVDGKVMVSGMVDVDPTAATVSTQLGISLPVASNFGAIEDCGGTAFATGVAGQGGGIIADVANNRAQLQFISADTTNQPMAFSFMYDVI